MSKKIKELIEKVEKEGIKKYQNWFEKEINKAVKRVYILSTAQGFDNYHENVIYISDIKRIMERYNDI